MPRHPRIMAPFLPDGAYRATGGGTSNREAETVADELTVSREGDVLVIRIPIKTATPSASGKTLVVASTRGNQRTGLQIDGNDLYLGVNAYVYAEPKKAR